jgi:hypothetical protein
MPENPDLDLTTKREEGKVISANDNLSVLVD